MYARDKLMEQGVVSDLKRVPAELARTCGQALYVRGHDLQKVLAMLSQSQIETKGVFHVTMKDGKPEYNRIK